MFEVIKNDQIAGNADILSSAGTANAVDVNTCTVTCLPLNEWSALTPIS
jgi:hypothetical protein